MIDYIKELFKVFFIVFLLVGCGHNLMILERISSVNDASYKSKQKHYGSYDSYYSEPTDEEEIAEVDSAFTIDYSEEFYNEDIVYRRANL